MVDNCTLRLSLALGVSAVILTLNAVAVLSGLSWPWLPAAPESPEYVWRHPPCHESVAPARLSPSPQKPLPAFLAARLPATVSNAGP